MLIKTNLFPQYETYFFFLQKILILTDEFHRKFFFFFKKYMSTELKKKNLLILNKNFPFLATNPQGVLNGCLILDLPPLG